MTVTTEKQKALVAILNEHLLYPTENEWIDSEEIDHRTKQTRKHLAKATAGEPAGLVWLALQEDFGEEDCAMSAYHAHQIVVELLSEP